METINQYSHYLIILINAGAIVRIIYCTIVKNSDSQSAHIMNKRIKHILLFIAIADTIFGLSQIALNYWG